MQSSQTNPSRHLTIVGGLGDDPRELGDASGEAWVHRLVSLANKEVGVEQSVEIGKLVIEQLYAGDLTAWRDRGPKAHSLRTLARRTELPVSSSALYRSIALYELSERLGGLDPWISAGLGISHLRLVLGLQPDDQRRLLDLAVAKVWTVAELEREAVAARRCAPKRASRGGRPRTPRFLKSVHRLRRAAESPEEMFGDLDAVSEMNPAQLAEVREALAVVRARCADLEQRILANMKP